MSRPLAVAPNVDCSVEVAGTLGRKGFKSYAGLDTMLRRDTLKTRYPKLQREDKQAVHREIYCR